MVLARAYPQGEGEGMQLQKRWQKLTLVVTRSKPQFGHGLFDPPKVGGGGGGGVFLVTVSILASLLS